MYNLYVSIQRLAEVACWRKETFARSKAKDSERKVWYVTSEELFFEFCSRTLAGAV